MITCEGTSIYDVRSGGGEVEKQARKTSKGGCVKMRNKEEGTKKLGNLADVTNGSFLINIYPVLRIYYLLQLMINQPLVNPPSLSNLPVPLPQVCRRPQHRRGGRRGEADRREDAALGDRAQRPPRHARYDGADGHVATHFRRHTGTEM